MKINVWISLFLVCALALALTGDVGAQDPDPPGGVHPQDALGAAASALGTSFTYQGVLTGAGGPVNGNCDLRFRLYDGAGTGSPPTGGTQIGSVVTHTVTITDGFFTVADLDFGGDAFDGESRWLEIAVRCPAGSGDHTTLSPPQALTATPYALYATRAPWSGLIGVPSGLDDGDDDTTYSAGTGLALTGTTFNVVTATVQQRVANVCGAGYAIRQVNADGSVVCEPAGGGDITAVYAGNGLTGGGGSGPVTLTLALPVPTATLALSATQAPWSGLTGVPAGFADGVDNEATVVSGTNVFAGDGLIRVASGDAVTLSVDFAGDGTASSVARSDHGHDSIYAPLAHTHPGSDITSPVPTATLALSATQAPWSGLVAVPAGFVDGMDDTDDTVDWSEISPIVGSGADEVAAGDHTHDDRYYTETELQTGGSASVHWGNLTGMPADLADGDDDTTYTAGMGLALTGTTFNVVTATVQQRVADVCGAGYAIRQVNADGSVVCEPTGGGDITAVYPGAGLTGGGESGPVTLALALPVPTATLALSATQAPWSGLTGVPAGFVDGVDNTDDTVDWSEISPIVGSGADEVAAGDHIHDDRYYTETELQTGGSASVHWGNLTGVPAGLSDGDDDTVYSAGLGLSLDVTTFSVVTSTIQQRVAGFCGSGTAIRQVNADGTVACEPAGDGDITAVNAGPGLGGGGVSGVVTLTLDTAYTDGHYWSLTGNSGTTPGTHFLGTTDAVSLALAVDSAPALRLEFTAGTPNLVGGHEDNYVMAGVTGATIGGGGTSGFPNQVTADYATVGGGSSNTASGQAATVPGGWANAAAGDYSFAAGRRAKAYHDGAFVWADSTDADFSSTATDKFLVRAANGATFSSNNVSYGLQVNNDGNGDGLRVTASLSQGNDWAAVHAVNIGTSPAVFANTGTGGTYSGYFMDNIYVAGDCVGCTPVYIGLNDGDDPLERGDLVAVSGVSSPLLETTTPVIGVRLARAGDANAIIGVVQSRADLVESSKDGQLLESANRVEGAAAPGDYLFIVVQGVTYVKVDATAGDIVAGQRLTAADQPGHARVLQTRMLEGMAVTEGAPVVGIALESLDEDTGMIPVFVTLR
jgi:hypothetical protein